MLEFLSVKKEAAARSGHEATDAAEEAAMASEVEARQSTLDSVDTVYDFMLMSTTVTGPLKSFVSPDSLVQKPPAGEVALSHIPAAQLAQGMGASTLGTLLDSGGESGEGEGGLLAARLKAAEGTVAPGQTHIRANLGQFDPEAQGVGPLKGQDKKGADAEKGSLPYNRNLTLHLATATYIFQKRDETPLKQKLALLFASCMLVILQCGVSIYLSSPTLFATCYQAFDHCPDGMFCAHDNFCHVCTSDMNLKLHCNDTKDAFRVDLAWEKSELKADDLIFEGSYLDRDRACSECFSSFNYQVLTPEIVNNEQVEAMSAGDWMAMFLVSGVLALYISKELQDLLVCRKVAQNQVSAGGKHYWWAAAFTTLDTARLYVFMPLFLVSRLRLVLNTGATALNIILGAVSAIFIIEVNGLVVPVLFRKSIIRELGNGEHDKWTNVELNILDDIKAYFVLVVPIGMTLSLATYPIHASFWPPALLGVPSELIFWRRQEGLSKAAKLGNFFGILVKYFFVGALYYYDAWLDTSTM